ncbi:calcium-transporting ATPase [Coprinopsis marcescibilis]|uniref:Calcium-transporting ATPase n=1 Tax=Coprinopsis marcescibilis TaxID=230819 RepID=A0A5C3L6L9_COPMA|nr:calcium-transporting ATPase [Coprinopsis marcescibilis]
MASSSNEGNNIPSINIVTDLASTTSLVNTSNVPPSQHTGLLSPRTTAGYNTRTPDDAPSSPSDQSDAGSSAPPSPTLSNHSSGNFNTTLALRDNQPESKTGLSSLALLSPENASLSTRRPSNATIGTMTDVGHSKSDNDLRHVSSTATSVTHVDTASHLGSSSKKEKVEESTSDDKDAKKKKKKKGDKAEDDKTTHQLELEQDAAIDPAPFPFKPYQLAHMLDPKNIDILTSFGGAAGIIRGLGTHADHGLSTTPSAELTPQDNVGTGQGAPQDLEKGSDKFVPAITLTAPGGHVSSPTVGRNDIPVIATFEDRKRVYGANVLPTRPSKTLLQLMWMALKDKVLILLCAAAAISLALGIYQALAPNRPHPEEPAVEWVEGVAIILAVTIVVVVGSLNDWQKERQFKVLNEKKEERGVKVIRDGIEKVVDIKEVVVGDIALLEPGEIVPCDGIFLSGHNVKCDESGATGESDAIKKQPFEEIIEQYKKAREEGRDPHMLHSDCFMISGSKVLEGVGKYVVVAVGPKSFNGRIMMALRGDTENTPLQLKLNNLAELIAKIGAACGLVMFIALMIRFFVQLGRGVPERTSSEKGTAFVNILIISVTLVVVAVPEGLPLAVTLALAFATKRMTLENLLVRVLGSCETMANASVICTDKTGTLTTNAMTVVAGSVGVHCKFVRQLDQNAARTNADETEQSKSTGEVTRKDRDDFSIDQGHLNDALPPVVRDLFNEAISVNSTAFQDVHPESGEKIFVGSKTETALLQFAKELGWRDFKETRDSAVVVQMVPFSSERKAMGVVVKRPDGGYRFYSKGASEILSRRCSHHLVIDQDGGNGPNEIQAIEIDEMAQQNISRTIIFYANQTLRTIAICYRDLPSWPPAGSQLNSENEVPYEDLARDLTLIGITGIEDPLRDGVRESVGKCHHAGVSIKMCTGDNVLTARSIANQCGIFTPGGIIMEGPVFRKLTNSERIEIVPRLQVLARSSPEDKKVLVETLKAIGEVVGVTGDGTNDGPALKTAHVGFSMGIAGTEVAKEASDIILMDDNFSSIVKAIMWGRCVNDAVRKFLQFQISTNVTAVVITFVSAVASEQEQSVLSAVQLLWINIIMDTFAALALATDPATEALLDRKPDKKTAPLFSVDMYKMILMQSVYQIAIILLFHFKGTDFLGFDNSARSKAILKTLVFNAFVFAQIFNSVNCRRLDNKLNIFEGIFKNPYFIVITLLEVAIQVVIMIVGGEVLGFGAAFQVTKIGGREWGISLALGVVSIPWGAVIRCMPNKPFFALFDFLGLFGKQEVLPTATPDREGWGGAFSAVQDNLKIFANLRGARLRSSSFAMKSRNARPAQDSAPIASIMTIAPTMIMAAAVAGSTYKQTGSLSDPAGTDPSKSSAALWEGKLQMHPDTPQNDPMLKQIAAANDISNPQR